MAEIHPDYIHHISEQIAPDELSDFLAICQSPLRVSIRINTLKISVNEFKVLAEQNQWQLLPVPWCESGFWLERPANQLEQIPLGNTPEHLLGLIYIQEASSMLPAEILLKIYQQHQAKFPEKILDMAAAPGSKTTQLAAITQQQALLFANELSSSRLKSLANNFRRTGVVNYCLLHKDGQDFSTLTPDTFDAILLDAPCGGEGTVRKDPNALKHWAIENVLANAGLQQKLIEAAFIALKDNGVLVYSTCTLSREENEAICHQLLQAHPEQCSTISLQHVFPGADKASIPEGFVKIWPHIFDSEGFFVAAFKKLSAATNNSNAELTKSVGKICPSGYWSNPVDDLMLSIKRYFLEHFAFDLNSLKGQFLVKNDKRSETLWLFPSALGNSLFKTLKPNRTGIKIVECFTRGRKIQFRLNHECCIAFGKQFKHHVVSVTLEQLQQIYLGKDITIEDKSITGDCVIVYEGQPAGIVRAIKGRLKNNLPRELLKDRLNWIVT